MPSKEELLREKQYKKERKEYLRKEKEQLKELVAKAKRELAILNFMYKTDVLNHHHGVKDSLKTEVLQRINKIKQSLKKSKDSDGNSYHAILPIHTEYHPYWWNYNEAKSSHAPLTMLYHFKWNSREFKSIYDVPLDGSYRFYCYDSGQRGLGSLSYMSVEKVEIEVTVPYVNACSIIPITC